MRGLLLLLLSVPYVAAPAQAGTGGGNGKVFLTKEEALALAFPKCEVERLTAYLNEEQLEQAEKLADAGAPGPVVRRYRATRDGKVAGTAYFDTHRVRSLGESIMIVVDARERIARIEVLRFDEPIEYLPNAKWYGQFLGKELSPELRLKKDIRPVTGATLTARATTEAARRVLAVHHVLEGAED